MSLIDVCQLRPSILYGCTCIFTIIYFLYIINSVNALIMWKLRCGCNYFIKIHFNIVFNERFSLEIFLVGRKIKKSELSIEECCLNNDYLEIHSRNSPVYLFW